MDIKAEKQRIVLMVVKKEVEQEGKSAEHGLEESV